MAMLSKLMPTVFTVNNVLKPAKNKTETLQVKCAIA